MSASRLHWLFCLTAIHELQYLPEVLRCSSLHQLDSHTHSMLEPVALFFLLPAAAENSLKNRRPAGEDHPMSWDFFEPNLKYTVAEACVIPQLLKA